MKKNGYLLSVVIPAYNEAEKIYETIIQTFQELKSQSYPCQIVVVDDGSLDDTAKVVAGLLKKKRSIARDVRFVSYFPNQGKGWALRKGFEASDGDYVAFFDGDLEIGPEHITKYLQLLRQEKADAVIGSKRHPESILEYSKMRVFISNLYYWFNRVLFRFKIKDTQSGMKVFRREVLEKTMPVLLVKRFVFDLELLSNVRRIGGKIIEAPLAIRGHQEYGTIRFIDLWYSFIDTLAVFFRLRILKYYNWLILPAKHRSPNITLLILAKKYSSTLQAVVERCRELKYEKYEIKILADEGGFSFSDCEVIETGLISRIDKVALGTRKGRGSIIAVLDEECLPGPEWLNTIASYLAHKEIDFLGGPVLESPVSSFWQRMSGWVARHPFVVGKRFCERFLLKQRFTKNSQLRNFAFTKKAFSHVSIPENAPMFIKERVYGEMLHDNSVLYTPDLAVHAESLHLFKEYFAAVGQEAAAKGRCCHRFPEKYCKVRWFFPSFFVIALVLGAIFASFSAVFSKVYCVGLLLFYLGAVVSSGFFRKFYFGAISGFFVLADYCVRGVCFLRGVFSKPKK